MAEEKKPARRASFFGKKPKEEGATSEEETTPLTTEAPPADDVYDHPHYGPGPKLAHTKFTVRPEEVYMKGILAFVFSGVSLFTCFYAWPEVEALYEYETTWKQFMFWLSVVLTIPSMYQTTLMMFTFVAVFRDKVDAELKIRRPIWLVILYGVGFAIIMPFVLPVLLVLAPFVCLTGLVENDKMALVLVAMIDFFQTIVLIPLAYVVVFSADCTEDVFLKTVVVQVYATMDDEFVRAFLEGPNVKQEALDTYCDYVEVLENGVVRHADPLERQASLAEFAY